jgi:hypothetical protein
MRFEEFARLDELVGTKTYNPEKINNLRDLKAFMAQFGFNVLSGGEFSLVFENPKLQQVVKVYNDECYDNFIALCKANSDNPHLPKFKGTSVRPRPNARMIRIERLQNMSDAEYKILGINRLLRIAKDLAFNVEPGEWEVPPESQSLLDAFVLICKNLPHGKCFIDMHEGNIMLRGNTPVIIDPFAPDAALGWHSTHK